MTAIQAKKLVAILLAAYPAATARVNPDDGATIGDAYARMLEDLDVDAATAAVKRLMGTSRYLPTIAEIRAAALDVSEGSKRAPGDAWGDVQRAIGRYGMNRTPGKDFEFADPIVARTVDAMGWRALCVSDFPVSDRARFCELYGQLVEDTRRERLVAGIPGASAPALRSGTTEAVAPFVRALVEGVLP